MEGGKLILPYISTPVMIGTVPVGGTHPIRLQSMTNTDTLDTAASVAQCIRIIEAGADYVRLTAQGVREAENLAEIKKELRKAGFNTPLIADIHFNPQAAETAARLVEKVRINPGNYVDKRASFGKVELSEEEYNGELERIHDRLLPLIRICSENDTAVRIGINHGSLSDRIMTRYGNTPAGMVASALEFIDIFRAENFNRLVLSMKSSDTSVMIEATRMLVLAMQQSGVAWPLHLGVTEAGEGEDGRVRSAAGIGALLAEGIGDTIRVSLSEDPEAEIPVARKLADFYPRGSAKSGQLKPAEYRTADLRPEVLGKISGPLVMANLTFYPDTGRNAYIDAGFRLDEENDELVRGDGTADLVMISEHPGLFPGAAALVVPYKIWFDHSSAERLYPLFSPETYHENKQRSESLNLLLTGSHFDIRYLEEPDPAKTLVIFTFSPDRELYAADIFLKALHDKGLRHNVILNPVFREKDPDALRIKAAALLGRFLTDHSIAGIMLYNSSGISTRELTSAAFSILQCTGTRITRTMYLSCPTCGRTKFRLQDAVKKVKAATGHLKGLKIAVMGCIVNGPGEMAGADYGYVGAAEGKVHIYRGTEAVLKNIPEKDAAAELLRIIEQDHPAT